MARQKGIQMYINLEESDILKRMDQTSFEGMVERPNEPTYSRSRKLRRLLNFYWECEENLEDVTEFGDVTTEEKIRAILMLYKADTNGIREAVRQLGREEIKTTSRKNPPIYQSKNEIWKR